MRDLSQPNNNHAAKLVEIGPRFVMQLIRIFDGSFCGATLYENPEYKVCLSPPPIFGQWKGVKVGGAGCFLFACCTSRTESFL